MGDDHMTLSRKRRKLDDTDQAEIRGGHTYGTVNVYGNARAVLGNFVDSDFLKRQAESDRKSLLLQALYYDGMGSRKAQIDKRAGSPKSIDWIWSTNFNTWLCGSESFFWITGRPGSGKSTLIKHLADSRRTLAALKKHDNREWVVVHHFFDFRAGHKMPNRVDGMLRSLLHQIARCLPEAADEMNHYLLDEINGGYSLQQCLNMLCDIVRSSTKRLIAFVDGLDEHQGSTTELIDTIFALEDRVEIKICLASRPELIFERELSRFQHLAVQDYNHESIKTYTEMALSSARYGPWVQAIQALSGRIREQANGVFLWARLAVDELMQRAAEGQSEADLSQVLDAMPAEVEGLYQRILDSIPQLLRTEAAILLNLLLDDSLPHDLWGLFAALEAVARHLGLDVITVESLNEPDCRRRLLATLGSLLDLSCVDSTPDNDTVYISASLSRKLHRNEFPLIRPKLMHDTLRTFLSSSRFMAECLPKAYRQQYSSFPWLHIFVKEVLIHSMDPAGTGLILQHVSLETIDALDAKIDLVRDSQEFALRKGKDLSKWQASRDKDLESDVNALCQFLQPLCGWTPMLTMALSILPSLLVYMQHDLSVDEKTEIDAALDSGLFVLHYTNCRLLGSERDFCRQIHGTMVRAHCPLIDEVGHKWRTFLWLNCHGLFGYALRLLISQKLSLAGAQQYFDLLWAHSLYHDYPTEDLALLFEYLCMRGAVLMCQHLCALIHSYGAISRIAETLDVLRRIPRLFNASSSHPFCEAGEPCQDALLRRWVGLTSTSFHFADSQFPDNHFITYDDSFVPTLNFILWWMLDFQDINSTCSISGTVLHTLLEYHFCHEATFRSARKNTTMVLHQLIMLSETNIQPRIVGQRGTALQTIEYLIHNLRAYESEDDRKISVCNASLYTAQAARDILQHYEDDDCWPERAQMEQACDQAEQQWKKLPWWY